MKKFIFIMAIFLLNFFFVFAQNDLTNIYNKLLNIYGEMTSVSFEFKTIGRIEFSGSFKGMEGSKYYIKSNERNIVCNGKTIWNNSLADNNVVISDFVESESEFSFESIFFEYLVKYYPTVIENGETESGKKSEILTLKPQRKEDIIGAVTALKLWLDKDTYRIMQIGIEMDGVYDIWEISNLIINPKFDEKIFEFKPGDDVQVIDFR